MRTWASSSESNITHLVDLESYASTGYRVINPSTNYQLPITSYQLPNSTLNLHQFVSVLFLAKSAVQLLNLPNLTTLLLILGLVACQPEAPQIVRPPALPQDDHIQAYMNHEPAASYTEPYRSQTRDGDNFEQIIVDTIKSARSTVDIAVQELRLPGIAQALVDRHKAGVKVRVVLENTYSRPYSQFTLEEMAKLPERDRDRVEESRRLIDLNGDGQLSQEESNQRDALVLLDQAGVPRIDDTADGSAGSNLMHHKFLVIDGQTLIVTSANFTISDVHGDLKSPHSRGNANNLLKIASPELAALFTQEFNYLWGDGVSGQPNSVFGVKKPFRPAQSVKVGATTVEVQFSPTARSHPWEQSGNGLIGRTLSHATRSIQMALFVFSDQQLVNLLEGVSQKGTKIKALIEPGFAYRPYSEALDMLGVSLTDDCKLEANNRPWQQAIATVGIPRMPPGDLLHHKFGIVDQQTIVTGSHNWTDAANIGNDETILVIHNPTVTAHYQREFDRLYTNAILGVPPAIQKKVTAQAQQCSVASTVQPVQREGARRVSPQATASTQNNKNSTVTIKPVNRVNQQPSQRVNLNTATQAELEELPGVGPGLAKRIIMARQVKRFSSLADLDQVSGVGPKLLKKLEDKVEW